MNNKKIYIAIIYICVILFCIDRERGNMSKNRVRILVILGEIAVILVLAIVILMPKTPYPSMGGKETTQKAEAAVLKTGNSGNAENLAKAGKVGENAGEGGNAAGTGGNAGEIGNATGTSGNAGSIAAGTGGNAGASGTAAGTGESIGAVGTFAAGADESIGASGNVTGQNGNVTALDVKTGSETKAGSNIAGNVTAAEEEASLKAAMYDYDAAIEQIKAIPDFEKNEGLKNKVKEYETARDKLVKWEDNTQISHLFVHSLIVDTARAFRKGSSQPVGYNRYMTTVGEFKDMLESLYEKGYVLVSMHDIAERYTDVDGVEKLRKKPIYLPEGKMPFVLSQDDVNYYEYMENDGFADRLVIGEDGRPTCQYTDTDGNVTYGEYDVLPIVDNFLIEHPDFSYRGAKGILAVTGYEGALGYDTGWHMYDLDNPEEAAKLKEQQEAATAVAEAIKADGWEFASHSYTHTDMKTNSYEKVIYDTDKWEREVQPILGDTDLYIYPFGSDICDWRGYKGDKFEYLKKAGFWYFCNVDASRYWIQITDKYMRMGRINADGERMMKTPNKLDYFFDSAKVLDKTRPALE